MSGTIWKFRLDRATFPYWHIEMPKRAVILTMEVDAKDGEPCIWAMVNPRAERTERHFLMVGTGHPTDVATGDYLGTFQEGGFVWHVFECSDNRE